MSKRDGPSIECCQQYYLKSTDENEKKAVRLLNNPFADRDVRQEEGVRG